MEEALRAQRPRIAATRLGALLVVLLAGLPALAQPLEVTGLRGGRYVGSALPLSAAPRARIGLGYAYTESVIDGTDRHQRAFSELSLGYAPWSLLQLSLGVQARYDAHRSERAPRDRGGAFASELTTRHAFAVSRALSLAAHTRLRFPASESVGRGLRAATPELGLLGSHWLGRAGELSLLAGYRFERSAQSVRDASALSAADRLAASLSRYDAALFGALWALPIGALTASLEWSWDLALGASAPRAASSPMRVRTALQALIGARYLPGIEFGMTASARPELARDLRIEPRLWVALSLGVRFERARAAPKPARAPPPAAPAEPVRFSLQVLDPRGAPVAGAQVAIEALSGARAADRADGATAPSEAPRSEARAPSRGALETDAEGCATLLLEPARRYRLTLQSPGFLPHEAELDASAELRALTVTLRHVLPEGQIQGKVRSLHGGRPLRARVQVRKAEDAMQERAKLHGVSERVVETDADGNFSLDVPPGAYTLDISAEGHESQQRHAQVEHLGVTILVVDLRRAPK